jgi:hypothetical protein
MGGKTALHLTAHNVGNLADRVAMVVTINSPLRWLGRYYAPGGGPVVDFCRTGFIGSDEGICNSVSFYDSTADGEWVSSNKHWLAFISAEPSPLSSMFNQAGIDTWPRNMDDGIVPISAQYSDGADVVYYGENGHNDFTQSEELAKVIASQILDYIFGGDLECSVLYQQGNFRHEADWFLGTDRWADFGGEVVVDSGRITHKNESFFLWQEWEDIVATCPDGSMRSSYHYNRVSLAMFTSIQEVRWLNPDNPEDCRLYIRTRAAPRTSVVVDWSINLEQKLPLELERDHYEVEIITGTPLTSIQHVSWISDDPRDLKLGIISQADSPFRWFQAEWRVYYKEERRRKIIDEITGHPVTINR